jgi:hypothetical protein
MEFCNPDEADERALNIARAVFETLAPNVQERIESVCDAVALWIGGDARVCADFHPADKTIALREYGTANLSDRAVRGLAAHEFGHAYDYAVTNEPTSKDNRQEKDRAADAYASAWGFAEEIETLYEEAEAMD